MKQKLLVLLVFALVMVAAVGCQKKEPEAETPTSVPPVSSQTVPSGVQDPLPPVSSATYSDLITEDTSLTAQGCPPLSRDLQVLYQDAYEMYRRFSLCDFQNDSTLPFEIDGMTFYAITDPRFGSYQNLRTYLQRFFTDEFINEQLLNQSSCVREAESGVACVLEASGTENADYAGHVFRVDNRTSNRIELKATVYYAKDGASGKPFYTAPGNPERYTTKEYSFQLLYTVNGWRFTEFAFLQG